MVETTALTEHDVIFRRLHRLALHCCIGFFCVAALWGILLILTGGFNWLGLRVLITATTVSVAGGCLMACTSFGVRTVYKPLAVVGAGVVVLAATLLMIGVWGEVDSEGFWRLTGVTTVWGIAITHGFTILAMRVHPRYQLIQFVVTFTAAVLALMVSAPIIDDSLFGRYIDETWYFRLMAVVAIVLALGTILMPIFKRLSRGEMESEEDVEASTTTDEYTPTQSQRFATSLILSAVADDI